MKTDYYGIFVPGEDEPIGQVYRDKRAAEAKLVELRETAESFAGVPFAGDVVDATYVPFFAACYVAALGVGE